MCYGCLSFFVLDTDFGYRVVFYNWKCLPFLDVDLGVIECSHTAYIFVTALSILLLGVSPTSLPISREETRETRTR